MNLQYEVVHKAPTAEEYVHLRSTAGLSPKSLQAAEKGFSAVNDLSINKYI
ncbi:hypothetical protein J2S09_000173 [Bacillus fengqiuensis]|nr:hypothetical protein [Bacillus fengqiuensis]